LPLLLLFLGVVVLFWLFWFLLVLALLLAPLSGMTLRADCCCCLDAAAGLPMPAPRLALRLGTRISGSGYCCCCINHCPLALSSAASSFPSDSDRRLPPSPLDECECEACVACRDAGALSPPPGRP
jgi:hypothetical protein